jgi:hypothetical protein
MVTPRYSEPLSSENYVRIAALAPVLLVPVTYPQIWKVLVLTI